MSEADPYAALEALPAPVIVVEGERIVYVNAACVRALIRPREALVGARVREWITATVAPEDTPWVRALSDARVEGRDGARHYWIRLRDGAGRPRTFEVQTAPGPEPGRTVHLFIEAQPEAEARRLNEALAAASWSLVQLRSEQAVLEAAADTLLAHGFGVVVLLARGDHLIHATLRQDRRALDAVARTAGRPIEQMPLRREEAREFIDCLEQQRAIFIQDAHLLVDRFRPPQIARVIKATMPRRSVAAPIWVEGAPFGILTAQHDALTPSSVGPIELFAHRVGGAIENVRHHRRAEERLAELGRLQERLIAQDRLATLGEATAVLAHEIRNPVAAILNALAVVRRNGPASPEALRMAEEDALRLERLVQNLLHLASPSSAKMERLELRRLAVRTVEEVCRRPESTSIEPQILGAREVHARGDAFLLQLALENLVMNAIQASPPGGRVRLLLEAPPGAARIAVEDEGPGVRTEAARRLFEPFFTTKAAGTGLGLAVVRKVAEAHGGQVRLSTTSEGRTRFEFDLPLGE